MTTNIKLPRASQPKKGRNQYATHSGMSVANARLRANCLNFVDMLIIRLRVNPQSSSQLGGAPRRHHSRGQGALGRYNWPLSSIQLPDRLASRGAGILRIAEHRLYRGCRVLKFPLVLTNWLLTATPILYARYQQIASSLYTAYPQFGRIGLNRAVL